MLMFFVGAHVGLAFDVPDRPQSFVNDYANILSVEEKSTLDIRVKNFEEKTSNEIAIVIISSLDGDTIENVAQDIFTKWSIGKNDKNNGVLLLIAIENRKTRIHTGYGVEGVLTDIGTSYIQSEIMAPAFRENNYYAGIDGALNKMIKALGGNDIVPEGYSENTTSKTFKMNIDVFFALGFFLLQWLVAILGRSKSWWGGGILGAVIGGAVWLFASFSVIFSVVLFFFLIIFGLGLDFFVSRKYQAIKNAGGHFPWWIGGGGFGGGKSGSGFGGFGGGFSGGGGSSGSW